MFICFKNVKYALINKHGWFLVCVTCTIYLILCFLDVDVGPSPAEDVMAAQQKPKPTHATEEPLPPPPPYPQSSTPQPTASPSLPQQTTEKVPSSGGKVLAAPAVRKIAMEHNVRRNIHRCFLLHWQFLVLRGYHTRNQIILDRTLRMLWLVKTHVLLFCMCKIYILKQMKKSKPCNTLW